MQGAFCARHDEAMSDVTGGLTGSINWAVRRLLHCLSAVHPRTIAMEHPRVTM